MKKIFTLALLGISMGAAAQNIKDGSVFLGGSLGFSHQQREDSDVDEKTKLTTVSFSPSVGRFYRDNRMYGINLIYASIKQSHDQQKVNYYGGGVFLRQYLPLGRSFYLFAEEGLSGAAGKNESQFNETTIRTFKTTDLDLYFFPGIAYAAGRRCQVELSYNRLFTLNYSRVNEQYIENGSNTRTSKTNGIAMQAGSSDSPLMGLTLGVQWVLR